MEKYDTTNNKRLESNNLDPKITKNSDDLSEKETTEALKSVVESLEIDQESLYIKNGDIFNQLLKNFFQSNQDDCSIPASESSNYNGLRIDLNEYKDNDLDLLIKSFKNNNFVLDPFYVVKIISDAKCILKKMPNIRELKMVEPLESGAIIVGDLHGNLNDLNHIINKYGAPGKQFKHVFNGNYVGIGSKQIETLLILLFSFLIRPDRVFLNRGSHEDLYVGLGTNLMSSFLDDLRSKYGKYAQFIFVSVIELFSYLPLATSVSNLENLRIFVVHGGISDETNLDYITNKLQRNLYPQIAGSKSNDNDDLKQITDLLWSNPIRIDDGRVKPGLAKKATGCFFNKETNYGCLFGVDVTASFCKNNSFNFIIRSHQVRDKGFQEDHLRCFTLYSASNYLESNNYGAVIKIGPRSTKLERHTFKNYINLSKNSNYAIKKIKNKIQSNKRILLEKFQGKDKEETGFVTLAEWSNIMNDLFSNIPPKHFIRLKEHLLLNEINQINEVDNFS